MLHFVTYTVIIALGANEEADYDKKKTLYRASMDNRRAVVKVLVDAGDCLAAI